MSVQLEFLKLNAIDSSEVLERVREVEGSVEELMQSKLSPFTQADILERLDRVEEQGTRIMEQSREASREVLRVRPTSCHRLSIWRAPRF